MTLRLPRLFCLVSSSDDLSLLPSLAAAGVDGFQVRDKHATTRELLVLVSHVRSAVGSACVLVNDRLDVALAAGADGVHLGDEDLPVAHARRIASGLSRPLVVGATCRSREQVAAAAADGADYAGFGPIRPSSSKQGLPEALGVDAVAAVADLLPVIGIGGVDAATARELRAAGAHGAAVIGSVWRHPDPVQAAKELVTAVA